PLLRYDPAADTFRETDTFFYLDWCQAAVSRDGALIAVENATQGLVGPTLSVMDRNLHVLQILAHAYGGMAFDPTQDVFYAADAGASQLVAYDTHTWAVRYRMSLGIPGNE